MKRFSLILVMLILLVATLAQAQTTRHTMRPLSRAGRWDFSVQTRYLPSQSYEGDGSSTLDISDDLGWGFGFGRNINAHFNLGFSFNWRSVDYVSTAVDQDDPTITNRYDGELSTSNFAFTGEWNVLEGRFTPYVNGSFSWMSIDSNVFAGWGSGCWWDYFWGPICTTVPLTYGTTTTAYTLGVGLRYEITRSFFARGGYEHGWTGESILDDMSMLRVDVGWMF